MDLGTIFGTIGNAATGGLLGAVGGIVQTGLGIWQAKQQAAANAALKKLDFEQEQKRWAHDLEVIRFESQAKLQISEVDAHAAITVADAAAQAASFEADKRSYATDAVAERYPLLFALVDFTRGITRPAITAYLNVLFAVLATWITYELVRNYPQFWADGKGLVEMFQALVDALIFMATTATMWWFAARGISKKG